MTTDRPRCLIFDPFAGISGDMILGSLIDLGLSPEWMRELVAQLPVNVELEFAEVTRGSIGAQRVTVKTPGPEPARHLDDVLAILERTALSTPVRDLVATAFRRLAEVEGALHGLPPERVHFHEVGAADAIVDIVGAVAGIAELGVEQCYTRPVAIGALHGYHLPS